MRVIVFVLIVCVFVLNESLRHDEHRINRLSQEWASSWCLQPRIHPLGAAEYLACVKRVAP